MARSSAQRSCGHPSREGFRGRQLPLAPIFGAAMQLGSTRTTYDHRLRETLVRDKNTALASDLGIPRSTVASWLARGVPAYVVTLGDDASEADVFAPRVRVRQLERRVRVLAVIIRLLRVALRIARCAESATDAVDATDKKALLRAIERARRLIPRRSALQILGISEARLRAWQHREALCILDDATSCPRTQPSRLTASEVANIRDLVLSDGHRAFSVRALALHAQRIGTVFASPTRPNEIWHIDVSVIRLVDGTKVFVQAVLDNFSRKVLAHRVSPRIDPAATAVLLRQAAERFLPHGLLEP